MRATRGDAGRAANRANAVMTTGKLGRIVAVLLVVAAALFSAGAFYEYREGEEAAPVVEAAGSEAAEATTEGGHEEKLLGVDVESPLAIGLGALVSLALAALAWFAPRPSTFTAITVVASGFVIIGVVEVARKVDASEAGIALLAAVVAAMHAAAAVLSVVAAAQGRRQEQIAQPAT